MHNGIYHVRLTSSEGSATEGLVVLSQGSLNGGDMDFLYIGHLSGADDALSGRLTMTRWGSRNAGVFEGLSILDAELSGSSTPDRTFKVSGIVVSRPDITVTVAGRFLSAVNAGAMREAQAG